MLKKRNSGIELLKILAIFLIIIAHVTNTLNLKQQFNYLGFDNGYIQLIASKNVNIFILTMFMYFGNLGNIVFIICSSYFLLDMAKNNREKIVKLWLNTLIISLIFLVIYLFSGINIKFLEIIYSLFPTIFQNNWFITTYLLFLIIVPFLNIIIDKLDQKRHLRLTSLLLILYYFISFIKSSFGLNNIAIFITIYFFIGYLKKYTQIFSMTKKKATLILIGGIICLIILQLITNFLGLRFDFIKSSQLYWNVNNNPFVLVIALILFIIFKQFDFKNKFINYVSSLSLYIYLIHENILFRSYTRIYIWEYIYEKIGYNYIVIEVIILALLLFVMAALLSFIYRMTFEKIVNKLIEKGLNNKKTTSLFQRIENKILNYK